MPMTTLPTLCIPGAFEIWMIRCLQGLSYIHVHQGVPLYSLGSTRPARLCKTVGFSRCKLETTSWGSIAISAPRLTKMSNIERNKSAESVEISE